MKRNQRIVIILWLLISLALTLFPPWNHGDRGSFITKGAYKRDYLDTLWGRYTIDKKQLIKELSIAAAVAIFSIIALIKEKRKVISRAQTQLKLRGNDILIVIGLPILISIIVYYFMDITGLLPNEPNEISR